MSVMTESTAITRARYPSHLRMTVGHAGIKNAEPA